MIHQKQSLCVCVSRAEPCAVAEATGPACPYTVETEGGQRSRAHGGHHPGQVFGDRLNLAGPLLTLIQSCRVSFLACLHVCWHGAFGLVFGHARLFLGLRPSYRVRWMRPHRGSSATVICFRFRCSLCVPIAVRLCSCRLSERVVRGTFRDQVH